MDMSSQAAGVKGLIGSSSTAMAILDDGVASASLPEGIDGCDRSNCNCHSVGDGVLKGSERLPVGGVLELEVIGRADFLGLARPRRAPL